MRIKFSWTKRLLWVPPLFIGILTLLLAPMIKQAPPQSSQASSPKVVRVIKMSSRAEYSLPPLVMAIFNPPTSGRHSLNYRERLSGNLKSSTMA